MIPLGCGANSNDDDDMTAADDDSMKDDDSGDEADDDATSDDDTTPIDDDSGTPADDDDTSQKPPGCDTLKAGLNKHFLVDGRERVFYIDLPDGVEETWPWPIVFNWHGYGDTAANMRTLIADLVNYETFPFIGVTPDDTGMLFDWDLFDAKNPNNREIRLFDELLKELDKCWGVDPNHVHTMGFSFGGGVSDMLGVVRGDGIASIGTYSGVYASNPANVIPYGMADWPDLTTPNKYVELRIHGGSHDWMVLPFGQYAENDRIYMNANGHDFVICNHNHPHNQGPLYMGPETIIEFFRDHPLGTFDSPYVDGFPADYPNFCSFSPKNE